jgi:hypothetical protein
MCPECGNPRVVITPYDYGRYSQTGYSDAGERFACDACGAAGDADDLDGAESSRPSRTAPGERRCQSVPALAIVLPVPNF